MVPARQAYSHSASLGMRYSHLVSLLSLTQNSWASNHDTCSTGRSSPLNLDGLGLSSCSTKGRLDTTRHCAWVMGYLPMQNEETVTECWGLSFWSRSISSSGEPIRNVPFGISIISKDTVLLSLSRKNRALWFVCLSNSGMMTDLKRKKVKE